MSNKRYRAINCVFCREHRFTVMFSGLGQKDLEGEVRQKIMSNKITEPRPLGKVREKRPGNEADKTIVTLVVVTRGLTSSFICRPRPVAL